MKRKITRVFRGMGNDRDEKKLETRLQITKRKSVFSHCFATVSEGELSQTCVCVNARSRDADAMLKI